jgi:hypothetical protein
VLAPRGLDAVAMTDEPDQPGGDATPVAAKVAAFVVIVVAINLAILGESERRKRVDSTTGR